MASAQNPRGNARIVHVLHCVGECIEVLGAGHASMAGQHPSCSLGQSSLRPVGCVLICVCLII